MNIDGHEWKYTGGHQGVKRHTAWYSALRVDVWNMLLITGFPRR